jgi:hypothetical protein
MSKQLKSDSENVHESNNMYEKTIIFCLLGESVSTIFLRNWTEIVGYCILNKIKPILSTKNIDNFASKNHLLMATSESNKPFGGNIEYDNIIFISNKALCDIEIIKKLLSRELDIVTALSSNKGSLNMTNYIVDFDLKSENKKTFNFESLDDAKNRIKDKKETLVKVNYMEFTVVCIKSGVLEQIGLPWFNYEPKSGDTSGEVYFCTKCKDGGIDLYVDLDCIVPCEKTLVY